MSAAALILHRKRLYDDGAIAELAFAGAKCCAGIKTFVQVRLVLWPRWKTPDRLCPEAGKGDHRHTEDREEVYQFTTPEQLMADFLAGVMALRNNEGKKG